MAEPKTVHVAVGVVFQGQKVLLARRPDHLHQGGLLEFPGGKVEPGETVQQALVRELKEEINVRIRPEDLEPVIQIRHDYGDKRVFLDVWRTHCFSGEPRGMEGQEIHWSDPKLLQDDEFPAANRPILRAIRLPSIYAITGEQKLNPDTFARRTAQQQDRSDALFLLRAPTLSESAYIELAEECIDTAANKGFDLMLHGDPALLDRFPRAAGVHLPWRVAAQWSHRPIRADRWLAVSCHNQQQLEHAQRIAADFITLGAVEPTQSHPGRPNLGWNVFAELTADCPTVVYALGGLSDSHRGEALKSGAQGIAGISFWWHD